MFYHYGDPPGVVTAEFASGETVTVYIADEERIHAVIRDRKGRIIRNRDEAKKVQLPSVAIMPQAMPLQKREIVLNEL